MGRKPQTPPKAKKRRVSNSGGGRNASSSSIPSASELQGAVVGMSSRAVGEEEGDNTVHLYEMDYCDEGEIYGVWGIVRMRAVTDFYCDHVKK